MNNTVISVENLTKRYELGVINTGTLSRDLNKWFARLKGKPDPYAKIGQADHGNRQGDSILALDDVSFTVEQGEVLGIIGKNGAGKSTLLKILSQVTAPTSGVVKVMGRIGSLLEVGTGFHPELTGRENVYLNGAILGMRKDEVDKKFDEIVDFSGVEKFIDTPVKRYSSGMYVRLAFAVAAHLDPEILVVDEVLAVGDAEFQKKCLGKMGDVASEGRTVLFVSHNMAAIGQLCERAICLSSGRISEIGYTKNVIRNYLNSNDGRNKNEISLLTSRQRKGNGLVRFNNIKLKTKNGEITRNFNIGEDILIEFTTTCDSHLLGSRIELAIQIRTSDGIRICNMVDKDSNFRVEKINSFDKFSVKLRDVRFYPDVYYISIWAGSTTSTEVYDYLEDCISFEIVGGGEMTTRRLPKSAGLLFLTPKWEKMH